MHTLFRLPLILLSCLLIGSTAFAQSEVPQAPSDIPAQVEAFKKAQATVAAAEPSGNLLERVIAILPGKYSNEGQAALFPHIYELTPIWEDRTTDTYWFYEGISNAFDTDAPFSQHIVSIHQNKAGEVVWTNYHCSLLEHHTEVYKNPGQLAYIQKEDLKAIDGCGMVAKELNENHFMFRTSSNHCQDLEADNSSFMIFEYHFFPEGVASMPLAFDAKKRLIWGNKQHYYEMQRQADGPNEDMAVREKSTP